jgi:hypothetical protein
LSRIDQYDHREGLQSYQAWHGGVAQAALACDGNQRCSRNYYCTRISEKMSGERIREYYLGGS